MMCGARELDGFSDGRCKGLTNRGRCGLMSTGSGLSPERCMNAVRGCSVSPEGTMMDNDELDTTERLELFPESSLFAGTRK